LGGSAVTKFNVLLEFEANDELGVSSESLDAVSVSVSTDWILFYSGMHDNAYEIVAAFPTARVVSVVSVVRESDES
jgi:hypothetical protein